MNLSIWTCGVYKS